MLVRLVDSTATHTSDRVPLESALTLNTAGAGGIGRIIAPALSDPVTAQP